MAATPWCVISSVWPSGVARATCAVPTVDESKTVLGNDGIGTARSLALVSGW